MALSKGIAMIGVDCGATKILAQSAIYNPESGLVSPGDFHREIKYADDSSWNINFDSVQLDIQKQEATEGTINLSDSEIMQGNVIVKMIDSVLSQCKKDFNHIGICFPGIKNDQGVVVMANGPRIPNLYSRVGIETAYHDSDCCVIGEWKSTIGQLTDCKNAIYIGGGTGIADGIILNNELIHFNERSDIKRSWELIMENGQSVESLLSPKGMINEWNLSHVEKISTLSVLNEKNDSTIIFKKATEAFSYLIQDRVSFFQANNSEVEKIVIGQRLGIFMYESVLGTMIGSTTTIPIMYSTDRRTAALGAAWKKVCS